MAAILLNIHSIGEAKHPLDADAAQSFYNSLRQPCLHIGMGYC